jgi:hypothetical protein
MEEERSIARRRRHRESDVSIATSVHPSTRRWIRGLSDIELRGTRRSRGYGGMDYRRECCGGVSRGESDEAVRTSFTH